MTLCGRVCVPDWRFDTAYTVHAARPPHHIPPQPDTGQRCGPLQLQGWSCQGSEVPAHVCLLKSCIKVFGSVAFQEVLTHTHLCFSSHLHPGVCSGTPPSWQSLLGKRKWTASLHRASCLAEQPAGRPHQAPIRQGWVGPDPEPPIP